MTKDSITSNCCVDCVCLPICINKSYTELLYDCRIIRDSIRNVVNYGDLMKNLTIFFYGLERNVLVEIQNTYIHVLREGNEYHTILLVNREDPDGDW